MTKSKKLKLFYIDNDYVNYLSKFDNRIMFNKNGNRPYVGVILKINGIKFFSPLKTARDNTNANDRLTTKVLDESNKSRRTVISYIVHQNMIPVPDSSVLSLAKIIDRNDSKTFKYMLFKELQFLRKHEERIVKDANKVYKYYKDNKLPKLAEKCLDFDELINKCKKYKH